MFGVLSGLIEDYLLLVVALAVITLVAVVVLVVYYFKKKREICSQKLSGDMDAELYHRICRR